MTTSIVCFALMTAVLGVDPLAGTLRQPGEQQSRTWADRSGRYKVDAIFICLKDGKVTLERTDGKEITLPLEKLSAADQQFVERHQKAERLPEVEQFLQDVHNTVLSAQKEISLERENLKKRHATEMKEASADKKLKNQQDAVNQQKAQLDGSAARLAIPIFNESPDIVEITAYITADGTSMLEARQELGGSPWKTYLGTTSGVKAQDPFGGNLAQEAMLKLSGKHTTVITPQNIQKLLAAASQNGNAANNARPFVELGRRHREELQRFNRAMKVAVAAETSAQQAVPAINKVAANRDALMNELARLNKEVKGQIDQALSIAKGQDPAKQANP